MRFFEFKQIVERQVTPDELEGMKQVIASKIKELPADDATAKALREIEDLLQHVNAGGRMGMIYDQLEKINDPAVLAGQKMLARYILSIDSTPDERKEMFAIWRSGKFVNIDKLLSKESVTFDDIFTGYSSNNLIKEFVNDIMEISALGHGRGEFGLNVLSKNIWKPEDNKGDLQISHGGKVLKVEVKTTFGGAARFSDQEVRPAEGYEKAASELNSFVTSNKQYPVVLPGSGLNLGKSIEVYQNLAGSEKSKFLTLAEKVISLIFGGAKASQDDVNSILKAIKAGNSGEALQSWSKASFNYYINQKEDDGVLAINLNEKKFVYYTEADDLAKQGLRFKASTPYLSSVKDPSRSAYPQLDIVPTTFGANAAAKAMPKINRNTLMDVEEKLRTWAGEFAASRGVTNIRTIRNMAKTALELGKQKVSAVDIVAELEKTYPELTQNLPTAKKPAVQQVRQPAPTAAANFGAKPATPTGSFSSAPQQTINTTIK